MTPVYVAISILLFCLIIIPILLTIYFSQSKANNKDILDIPDKDI